ncbi:uncharacterized protein L969DRAFT_52140, partial [Mixia osmundae IAM 14324]|uniref:uncharacterized protein n=1 Tax=Mixia osmundae (strain CBS 9802 / IAM 14324 / JCM 22182 / KY 12970) TaxID=764103 RepID=UPI0004A54CFB
SGADGLGSLMDRLSTLSAEDRAANNTQLGLTTPSGLGTEPGPSKIEPKAALETATTESLPSKVSPVLTPAIKSAILPESDKATPAVTTEIAGPASPETAPKDAPPPEPMPSLLQSYAEEVQVTLADQQADPSSPLYSVKTFEDLNLKPELLKGVYKLGFQKPSKIQERALPLLLQEPPRNMIGQSQSGTGKTAAFALTMLSRIDTTLRQPQAICLAPARELAMQILDVVKSMGQYTNVETFNATKGAVFRGQRISAQIIVGTPGTVIDMLRQRSLDVTKIRVFVLDEADNMLEQGSMSDQCITLKNQIARASPKAQIVLFSATFNEIVREFAARFAPQANTIALKREEVTLDAIKQFFMADCDSEQHKYEVLVELYSLLTIGQSIIFTRRRDTADKIASRMTSEGHKVVSLHGQLETYERDAVMESFREGKNKVLITTNVLSRGIDVMQVNMVVNYDMPTTQRGEPDPETYIHRIGRTGRFGRQGISINFVHDHRSFQEMEAIQAATGREILRVETSDFEVMEKTLKDALKGKS